MENYEKQETPARDGKEWEDRNAGGQPGRTAAGESAGRKTWFGRGIYGRRDVPIRLLDGFIGLTAVGLVFMVIWFAAHGGYRVSFDTGGGSAVPEQKLRHGEYVSAPETPVRPGYRFQKWSTSQDEFLAEDWDFAANAVEGDMTLYAVWEPDRIKVKLDPDGGSFGSGEQMAETEVTYGEAYGTLPEPEKEGFRFDGWIYSGEVIAADTRVTMTGEHVLTARWKRR